MSLSLIQRFALLAIGAVFSCGLNAADNASAETDISAADPQASSAGHGWVSLGFQQLYSHGDYDGPAGADSGNVHFYSMEFEASYFVAERWELHAAIPYIAGKYDGAYYHPQIPCPPNCAPTKIDDGSYHGFWQDWDFGIRYRADFGGLEVTPSLDVYIPSNNYPFYGSAGIGQRTTRIGVGVEVAHQFELSNVFYEAHYQYVFNEHVLHIDNNFYSFGVNVGYFLSPTLSVKALTDIKLGNGYDDDEIGPGPGGPDGGANPIWELHDKFRLEEHADIGGALDFAFAEKFLLSATVVRSVWGRANARLTYDVGFKLTRNF